MTDIQQEVSLVGYKKLHASVTPDQSGAIPYRIRDGEIEVLLVTTRKQGKWIVPKGWIEEDLSSPMSAAKEALEEAGVKGDLSPVSLGCYRHGGSDGDPIVEIFLMHVERELRSWPEQEERERQWVPLEEAYRHVEEDGLRSILDEAVAVMRLSVETSQKPHAQPVHPAVPASESKG